ncbi:MAG: response regulator transcription factor [Blautia sp.]
MIYCVEDERNIRELLVYTLGTTGFEAKGIRDGKELKKALKEELPQLILLDIMLPGEDGYSILEKLKSNQETRDIPVIMVTAKEAEYDKVRALDSGADDYITKPFGMMEFIARVKAVLRRAAKQAGKKEYTYKGLTIHVERHQVFDRERAVELTLKEFELLRYLMENQGIVLSRDQILEKIWGYEYAGETRTVDVHIRTLRQKLGDSGFLIETVRGVGYRIGDKQ